MAQSAPLTHLPIATATDGFYQGFNRHVTIVSKVLIGGLIIWAAAFTEQAGAVLRDLNALLLANFGAWYIYVSAFYVIAGLALALAPRIGRLRLSAAGEGPEFSRFSWFSMMFGAGISMGMLTFSTGEPIYHFSTNPDVIRGVVEGGTAETVRSAFKWSFFHWGLAAWGSYALCGLSLAYFAYRRGLPLTIRSALTPLFGRALSGPLGHAVDIVAVVATIVGASVSIGYGISQFASGIFNVTQAGWMVTPEGTPTNAAMLAVLVLVMAASTWSANSGVGKGIKWLSNINMGLSIFVLAFFLIVGSTVFALRVLFVGLFDYVANLPSLSFTIWSADGTATGDALAEWQRAWTILYWPWWIAFAPFVGMFLARISRGRTVREYILGAMIVPPVMCFVWFAFAGGTAIDLELSGAAQGAIMQADLSSQLFATLNVMLSSGAAKAMSGLIVVLLMTYLVTSADSAVYVVNTINAAGDTSKRSPVHIVIWGVALTLVIAVLMLAGGLQAIQTAMIIGALPFSIVLALMVVALILAATADCFSQNRRMPTGRAMPSPDVVRQDMQTLKQSAT